jgi:hypothetical protein
LATVVITAAASGAWAQGKAASQPAWEVLTKNTVYTKDNAPAAPRLEDLPLKDSVSQYGITWTFERPTRVGQFVNGDSYVVGPTTVVKIDPKPLYGKEIPDGELDNQDKQHPENQRVRNGFMLNPPAATKVSYDSGVRNFFDASHIGRLPAQMKGGDSLVSTISMTKGLRIQAPLRNVIARGEEDCSPIRLASILTCVNEPLPPDAFRPAFCDRQHTTYLARTLKRELLPHAPVAKAKPDLVHYAGYCQKPWVATCFFGFEQPAENMPAYGLEYGRVVGLCALTLCTDLPPQQKEPLLINFVQVGIDLGGMIRNGHPGFEGFGGHGSGRKLPIVFAGMLLGDDQLANVNKSFPKASFGEDEQTAYGPCWTGATVTFAGHRGIDERNGMGRSGSGPYEHKDPKTWTGLGSGETRNGDKMSEGYRRCCTSVGWIAQALTIRLMKAEKTWNHDAFLDYCDRWMYEDDTEFLKVLKAATGEDHNHDFSRQRQTWDAFAQDMWNKYRTAPGMPPTDGWKQPHDDSYYKNAMAHIER